jgi:hypothetical protein
MMLGQYIRHQIRQKEKQESDHRVNTLINLPANTFAAIYAENEPVFSGCRYNDEYYSEWEIYYASLKRDEDYEAFL